MRRICLPKPIDSFIGAVSPWKGWMVMDNAEGSIGIKTAMVLAAGLGKRMQPLTDRIPKPLVKLAGRTLLDHALDRLAEAGVEDAVVNVHYRASQIESHLQARARPRVIVSDERETVLDTGGGVRKALEHLGGQAFFVQNSDTVWTEGKVSNLRTMMHLWKPNRMDALLLLAPRDSSIGYPGRSDFHMD